MKSAVKSPSLKVDEVAIAQVFNMRKSWASYTWPQAYTQPKPYVQQLNENACYEIRALLKHIGE